MEVVAEGVETPDCLAWLRQAGCDTVQGFLFARPMPAAAFVGFVNQWRNTTMNANEPSTSCCVCCKERHCCKVSDEAAFCLIQRPYISKTLLT
ncbi:EAL domain-containing protein, partial [Salmonella enterica]|nr:EAL domain-containing protein [Salmonella enterica]MEE2440400.1 EAL domain-containing protein [Klebsiella pneumoniae]